MKIESSIPELGEAYLYGVIGAVQGAYKHIIKPHIENQPVALYAFCGVLGGLAVTKALDFLMPPEVSR